MPRKSRIDAPGALQHVIARGINGQAIFTDKADYQDFVNRLGEIVSTSTTACYAWALLPNHVHLLLKTGDVPVSRLMQRLLTGYVITYNRRHGHVGHLFQNRYKSILCQEEPYLLELVRYIHLNPLRADVVSGYQALARYPYCGHGVILGRREVDWQDVHYILSLFGESEKTARQRYRQFVRAGSAQGRRSDLIGGGLVRSHGGWAGVTALRRSGDYQKGDERILGDGEFVNDVLSQAEEHLEGRYRLQAEGYDIDRLIERVGEIVEMSPEELLEPGKQRKKVAARSMLCYWATDRLGISQTHVAKIFTLTQPAVSQAVRRGKNLVESGSYSLFHD